MSDETNGAQCVVPDCPEEPTVRLYYCPVHAQEPLRPAYEDGLRAAARVLAEQAQRYPLGDPRRLAAMRTEDAVLALLSDTPTAPAAQEGAVRAWREWATSILGHCDDDAEARNYLTAEIEIAKARAATPTAPACSHPALLWDPAAQVIRCGTVGCSAAWGLPSGLTPTAPAAVPVERLRVVAAGTVTGLLRERIVSLCDEAERNAKGEP